MNILVTGGSGWIGRYVVQDLLDHGHDVLSVDLSPPLSDRSNKQVSLTRYQSEFQHLRVDVTDVGQVFQAAAAAQAQAVIHLAAWPDPGIVSDAQTYGDNASGTFNVFQACRDLGIRRIVSASSSQVYGFAQHAPEFVPIDESHPVRPLNCYAAAKIAGEQAAEYFADQYGMTICSFRFQGVRRPADLSRDIDKIIEDPALGAVTLWTRVDVRDAASACRLAVETTDVPSGVYNITGSRIVLDTPTSDLITHHYGAGTSIREATSEHGSPMSSGRAAAAFGYSPIYPWSESQRFLDQ